MVREQTCAAVSPNDLTKIAYKFSSDRVLNRDNQGTEQAYFILYLKELEFRYNHKDEDIFDAIVAKLS